MTIQEQIAAWPQGGPQHSAARLRTAEEVLCSLYQVCEQGMDPFDKRCGSTAAADARAYLAAREKER